MSASTKPLRRPAYASQLAGAVGMPAAQIMVEAHIGKDAWQRAKARPWWGAAGRSLVVTLDNETTVSDYDFTCLHGLSLILDARDCSFEPALACATRMCEHGARTVLLIHPWARSADGFAGWQLLRCSLWAP